MEMKSFVKILRKVIREEVKAAVKEALNEQKTNHKQVINHGMDLHKMVERQTDPYKIKARKKTTYTKNSMLNELLNETANTAPSQELTDWSSMNFTSDSAESFGAQRHNEAIAKTMPSTLATHDTSGNPVDMNNENVAKTIGIMTKDYSGLMKAIDKRKGIK